MKTKLPAILLNVDFYSKPRNRVWIAENGAEAAIVLQVVWIASSQERGCKINKNDVSGLVFPIQIKKERVLSILKSAVSVGLLDEDNDHYFNSQILKDHTSFEVKRKNYSEGRKKREKILPESSQDSPKILPESCENHIERVPEPVIVYESEKEGGVGETVKPEEPAPTVDPKLIQARAKLCDPTGNEIWEKSNNFILTGRRPMKDYPGLWLTPHELKNVIEIYDENLPERKGWRQIFLEAQDELQTQQRKGMKPEHQSAFKYLTTFCLENAIKRLNEKAKLERNTGR